MCGRCVRRCFTVWKTSMSPSLFTLSMAVLRAQKAPVRPIPALHKDRVRTSVVIEREYIMCFFLALNSSPPQHYSPYIDTLGKYKTSVYM